MLVFLAFDAVVLKFEPTSAIEHWDVREWGMGNGEWEMGNGKWEIGNGKLKWEIVS